MDNICQLYFKNKKILPFKVRRESWGELTITVDRIENIQKTKNGWFCEAYTLSSEYEARNGIIKIHDEEYKRISCDGCYQWEIVD